MGGLTGWTSAISLKQVFLLVFVDISRRDFVSGVAGLILSLVNMRKSR